MPGGSVGLGLAALAVKICLRTIDPITLSLARFAVAGTITLVWQRTEPSLWPSTVGMPQESAPLCH